MLAPSSKRRLNIRNVQRQSDCAPNRARASCAIVASSARERERICQLPCTAVWGNLAKLQPIEYDTTERRRKERHSQGGGGVVRGGGGRVDYLSTRETTHSSSGVHQGTCMESTGAALEEMRGEQEFERRAHTDSTIRCC